MVGAPLRGRAFLHMDIFLFNDVSRFRHNESGFSQIFIYCGCVKSHGRVWKNEGLGVISLVFVGRKLHVGKGSCTLFLLFVSAAFAAKVSYICTCRPGNFFVHIYNLKSIINIWHDVEKILYDMMLNKILYIITICSVAYIYITWSPSSISDMMLNKILT